MRKKGDCRYDERRGCISAVRSYQAGAAIILALLSIALSGCSGYSNKSLYPEQVKTIYVEMFESESFRRGVEYKLSQAVGKRIEAETPYKIVTDRNRADTILSGKITAVNESILTIERQTGRALELNVGVQAVVNWKNLKTGELLLDNVTASATASYSEWQGQGFEYASSAATNKLSERIVELMEKKW